MFLFQQPYRVMPKQNFEYLQPVYYHVSKEFQELLPISLLFCFSQWCNQNHIFKSYGSTFHLQFVTTPIHCYFSIGYGDSAVALYSAIMSISRARQHNMLKSGGVLRDLEQNSPKTLKADPRVICQGAAGAFSHSAALRLFPRQKPIFLPGFRDVFEAVHNGAGDYGVLPVENSDAGSVSEVYDLIMKHRMFIVGAADIPVRHCLCRAKGTGAVKKVLSKHEALVQCSAYLAAHVIETEAYSNTAAAAKFIAETRPEGVGAVCSAQAAEEYGLEVIAADIQNTDNNCTRFIVISREAVLPEDAEKISLCFSLPHTPGSLCHTLERFALLGLNLTKIESRPIPERNFEYDFYLDFTGNVHDVQTLALICALSDEMPRFSFLGNYKES